MENRLDYNTALKFIEKIGIENGEELLKKDRLGFVKRLILSYLEHVPFQCITIISQSQEEKHVPTFDEVIEAVLSLEGGVCYTLNTFMCVLLQTLHLKADILAGSYSTFGDNHTHVVVLLQDLRSIGDNFIIDVGCGFPFKDPIPVSELPCSRYFAGLEYRYEWRENMILRLHRVGDYVPDGEKPVMLEGWRKVFHFDLHPVNFEYFRTPMKEIYIDETCSFHTTLHAVRYPKRTYLGAESGECEKATHVLNIERDALATAPTLDTDEERIMVAFKNQSFLLGPTDNALKKKIETAEWASEIKRHFPTIPHFKVDLAIKRLTDMKTTGKV
ncbi:hypothetical protein SK128_021136 [Halocaridina rubra]|uniref:arylamine N-acetyltransferase n=1 Tax=Halocaridina rubra TaxID=373956 RepID=A0AAN8X7V7_HALRR